MIQAWRRIANRIDALSIRERAMLFGGAVVVLIFILNFALLRPQFARQKDLSTKILQEQKEFAALQGQIQDLARLGTVDPVAVEKAKLDGLRKQIGDMRVALNQTQQTLIPAERMSSLLESLLQGNPRLRLRSMRTLPAAPLVEPDKEPPKGASKDAPKDAKDAAKDKAGASKAEPVPSKAVVDTIYRHGVDIEIEGNYLDLVDYLSRLEAMQSKFYWGSASLNVEEYPTSVLKLTLYSLSLEKRWLGL